MENKVCKNKNCMKPLPEGYKHKYCEACRNQQSQTVKKGLKGAGAVASLALTIVTAGKIKFKK